MLIDHGVQTILSQHQSRSYLTNATIFRSGIIEILLQDFDIGLNFDIFDVNIDIQAYENTIRLEDFDINIELQMLESGIEIE